MELVKLNNHLWEIPKSGDMLVSGRIYSNERLIELTKNDKSLQQVRNVAELPGIVGHSLAMPDIHTGYGFPIGGVAAMDLHNGVISPGGVGYDINCGVRLIKTNLLYEKSAKKKIDSSGLIPVSGETLKTMTKLLNNTIPAGVGSQSSGLRLSFTDLNDILRKGAEWAVKNGYGSDNDLLHTEENGNIAKCDPGLVSHKAKQRGIKQLGTLGSGNHFIEIGMVEQLFDQESAGVFGLKQNQVTLMIHSGSRGLGHQVCDDYLKIMKQNRSVRTKDPQLVSIPVNSHIGQDYFAAMNCAANFAWANRQMMMSLAEKVLLQGFGWDQKELGFSLIYDLCHNIAKIETHKYNGNKIELCVHRKGATRAFAPNHSKIPADYKRIGQPVIIPGDMGRYSFLCLGTEKAMEETFGSSCHGAGRILSRKKAIKAKSSQQVIEEMNRKKIYVHAASKSTLSEEMSEAYKDVSDVIEVMAGAGLLKKVVMLKPLGVVKG